MNRSILLLLFASLTLSGTASAAVSSSTGTVKSKVPAETVKRRQQVYDWSAKPDASKAPSLITALSDQDYYTRVLAAQGLGELRWGAARGRLETLLLQDPNAEVRESAVQALRQMPDAASVPTLTQALADSSEGVRIVTADTLGLTASTQAVKALSGAFTDKSVSVRRTAVVSLQRLNDPLALPALMMVLKDADVYVRANAVQAVGQLSGKKPLPVGVKEAFKDREPLVQASAARALAASGDLSGIDAMKNLAQSSDRAVRMIAIEAMGFSKDPQVKAQLKSMAADSDLGVQQAVAQALQRIEQRGKNEKK